MKKRSTYKIGLTYTGRGEKHQNYVQWLKDKDPAIEVVKLGVDGDPDAIKHCDALVLSGGIDIDPSFYKGERPYPKAPKTWRKDRDAFERSVFGYALEHRLPVMGVCRGLQLINVLQGGSLIQDLGQQGDETHECVGDIDKRHDVDVMEWSLLSEITGDKRGEVNSAHHQAIDRLGKDLSVSCRAPDGTIEAIEWGDRAGKSFLLAVQWHPERMYTDGMKDTSFYKRIRDRFIEEIKVKKTAHADH